jgi:trk system potassium uptake protein
VCSSDLVTHNDLDVAYTFGRGEVSMVVIEATLQLAGRTVHHLTVPGEIIVVSITRDGQAFMPVLGSEFREGDRIHLAVLQTAMERLEQLVGLERRM